MPTDRRKPQATPDARLAMVECYRNTSFPLAKIARTYGVSERTVYREAEKAGVRRLHWITEKDAARIVRLYAGGKGLTMAQIVKETGFGMDAIRKALLGAGVKIRRGRRYDG